MNICEFCKNEFEPKPRFKRFCSTSCKNPINRKGNIPWNKGLTKEDPRVLKNITSENRVIKCAGWNKGNKSERAKKVAEQSSKRMKAHNPNHNGVCNLKRTNKASPTGWKMYVRQVRKFTMRTKRVIEKQSQVKFGKKRNDFQLDHIIPLKQGFKENIPPYIIGSKYNIQVLIQEDNRKKWDNPQHNEIIEMIISTFMENTNELFKEST